MMKTNLSNKTLFLFLLAIGVNSFLTLTAQTKLQFEFRKDHTFKIAQFTDLHWDNKSPKCALTTETIQQVLAAEKPDLAILTGDIVTAIPAKGGWLTVSKIFSDARVPWAVTLGNHDGEPEITRDQIDWYRKTTDKFTASNNKSPIPSLAFFHIPLIEFNDISGKESTIGIKKGGIGSSVINSGLFASMFEKKDIMGVFVGHDHSNDYIGISHDICLAIMILPIKCFSMTG